MRIAIANACPIARAALRQVVESIPGQQVAWTASSGPEAIEQAGRDVPDLLLLDLALPESDGVAATQQIMAWHPCPILIVTADVRNRIDRVYEAMGHGALDATDTPVVEPDGRLTGAEVLVAKIGTVGKLIGKPLTVAPAEPIAEKSTDPRPLVLIGASTGGPGALRELLSGLPAVPDAGLVVVQHIDAAFTPGLASWLGEHCQLPVELIGEGRRPERGKVLLARTNDHLVLDHRRCLGYVTEPRAINYRPSVDVFFQSVATHWPTPGVAVLLTGMGRDGAEGLLRLRQQGWHTIAQDRASSVVWGMPRAAVECGAAVEELPLAQIAPAIVRRVSRRGG